MRKSEFKKSAAKIGESTRICKLASSANNRIEQPMTFTMSFILRRNKIGPKLDLRGTPVYTEVQLEADTMFTTRQKT